MAAMQIFRPADFPEIQAYLYLCPLNTSSRGSWWHLSVNSGLFPYIWSSSCIPCSSKSADCAFSFQSRILGVIPDCFLEASALSSKLYWWLLMYVIWGDLFLFISTSPSWYKPPSSLTSAGFLASSFALFSTGSDTAVFLKHRRRHFSPLHTALRGLPSPFWWLSLCGSAWLISFSVGFPSPASATKSYAYCGFHCQTYVSK